MAVLLLFFISYIHGINPASWQRPSKTIKIIHAQKKYQEEKQAITTKLTSENKRIISHVRDAM